MRKHHSLQRVCANITRTTARLPLNNCTASFYAILILIHTRVPLRAPALCFSGKHLHALDKSREFPHHCTVACSSRPIWRHRHFPPKPRMHVLCLTCCALRTLFIEKYLAVTCSCSCHLSPVTSTPSQTRTPIPWTNHINTDLNFYHRFGFLNCIRQRT